MSYERWLPQVDLFRIGLRVADKRPSWRLSTYSIPPLPSTVSLPLPLQWRGSFCLTSMNKQFLSRT